jgi:hypothetical protein
MMPPPAAASEPIPPPPVMMPAPAPFALPPPPPPPAGASIVPPAAPVKLDSTSTTIKFGLLLQPQFESLGDVTRDGYANNIYLRRIRLLLGGTVFGFVDYFVETDSPNALKGTAGVPAMGVTSSLKGAAGMSIQDALVTLKPMGDLLKVDVGYMLPPMAHNAIQGASTLYGWDYFAYTFQHNNIFGTAATPVGRDVGAELRGLVLGGHLEYRAGLFQGQRNAQTATEQGARNFMRVVARLQINVLDAEPGFFYSGTYFGAKKILSLGGSYDFQSDYKYFAFDAFVDLPVGPGVLTAQVNVGHWDGGGYLAIAKQTAIMGEAGYNFAGIKVSPIVRVEHLSADSLVAAGPRLVQTRYAGGLAWWPYGHNSNLKAFYTRIQQDNADHGANQFNLQWQVYFF